MHWLIKAFASHTSVCLIIHHVKATRKGSPA